MNFGNKKDRRKYNMKMIKIGNKILEIDCNNEMCGNCSCRPTAITEQKCRKFNVVIDHLLGSPNDGWKRCSECINAEIKE